MEHHYRSAHRIFRIKKELGEVFLNNVILVFAVSLIGVFVPLYLLDIGFRLPEVFIFFIIHELSWVFFTPFTVRIGCRIGVRYMMAVGVSLLTIFFSLLLLLPQFNNFFLYFAGAIGGVAFNLYWSPLNTEFVKNIDKIYETQEIGESLAFPQIAIMFSPLLGGILLTILGFNILFSIAVALMIFSLIPFLFLKDYQPGTFRKHRKSMLWKNKKIVLRMFFKGIYMVGGGLIWPLYIFFTLNEVIPVGIAATLQGIAITIFTLSAGWLGKKISRNKMFYLGALIYAIAWMLRGFASIPLEIYMISFIAGTAWALTAIPVFASFSDIARKENILIDAATRESILHFGKFIPIILLLLLPLSFTHIFIFISILSLVSIAVGLSVKK